MRKLALIILIVLITTLFVDAQWTGILPGDYRRYSFAETMGKRIVIDTITPLKDLIERLEKPWKFINTGHFNYEGYTDDMYSIAVHGDRAIDPLVKFIKSTGNEHAKYGAVYTLHLIGADKIDEISEHFIDKKVRNALLSLLKDTTCGELVMSLLLRDPWQSDVPRLFTTIASDKFAWYVTSGLNQYQLDNYPLDGTVPKNINKIKVRFPNRFISDNYSIILGALIDSIKSLNNPSIKVDSELLNYKYKRLWGNVEIGLAGDSNSQISVFMILSCIVKQRFWDYGMIGSKINYYVKDNVLYLCSPQTSREIVLNWWNAQSREYKNQFSADSSVLKKSLLISPFEN